MGIVYDFKRAIRGLGECYLKSGEPNEEICLGFRV